MTTTRAIAAVLGLFAACGTSISQIGGIPHPEGCTVSNGHGGYITYGDICVHPGETCCILAFYGPCPPSGGGTPATCLIGGIYVCCPAGGGCVVDRVNGSWSISCGGPLTP